MNTALVYTLNDQSNARSLAITIFGNPNDYAWRLANLPIDIINARWRLKDFYDGFNAVATDTQTRRIYYSINALGRVAYSLIYSNDTKYSYFLAPPISKRVGLHFAAGSPT